MRQRDQSSPTPAIVSLASLRRTAELFLGYRYRSRLAAGCKFHCAKPDSAALEENFLSSQGALSVSPPLLEIAPFRICSKFNPGYAVEPKYVLEWSRYASVKAVSNGYSQLSSREC